jgi:RNA polymerase sigma factor (sigma-70 family)
MTPDLDLLQQYARESSEEAFATLASRHLDLVYSAALRQVRSRQLAEEVAQSVFADLARNATNLKPDTVLTAWLYRVTRRSAIDVVRRESRRQLREQIAAETNAMNATADNWVHVEPFLDEAMETLDETDRSAVLLRYFENKSLREVGQTFGTSDDAAQKRVSRAVERLREFFAKRGVTVGASGLVVMISANAVQAAPIGLIATISTAASLAGTITTATTATHTTMTWINTKTTAAILCSALLAGTGTYLLQQREANRLRRENRNLIAAQEKLTAERNADLFATTEDSDELERLQKEKSELIRLRGEVGVLRQQASELKKLRDENRRIQIAPVAQNQISQLSEEDLKFNAHQAATINAMKLLGLSMRLYAQDHDNRFATDFDQMQNEIGPTKFSGGIELDAFEFVNAGLVNVTMPDMIIFRERVARLAPNGKWERVYTLADGSVQRIQSSDGNFDHFEKSRLISPPE